MPDPRLGRTEFTQRFLAQFKDPAFDALAEQLAQIAAVAWEAYREGRKSPTTSKAGEGFADPGYDRYIGYWKPYAISHDELDADEAVQEEVRNVARALLEGLELARAGKGFRLRHDLPAPRDK